MAKNEEVREMQSLSVYVDDHGNVVIDRPVIRWDDQGELIEGARERVPMHPSQVDQVIEWLKAARDEALASVAASES